MIANDDFFTIRRSQIVSLAVPHHISIELLEQSFFELEDAVRKVSFKLDANIRSFVRIGDRRIMRLIQKWLKAVIRRRDRGRSITGTG
jgi:hypothetical protein